MQGIALILDLLRKDPVSCSKSAINSYDLFSAAAAATSAAAVTQFASPRLLRDGRIPVAFCDSGTGFPEDLIPRSWALLGNIINRGYPHHETKEYYFELKPLWSAFALKALALTSMRSVLTSYLAVIERHGRMSEANEDFLSAEEDEPTLDLYAPLQNAVHQIIRETTVVTIRRIFERITAHFACNRTAWKLLKDARGSATRKAARGLPTTVYFFRVSRTTFRGHFLVVGSLWIFDVGMNLYQYIRSLYGSKQLIQTEEFNSEEAVRVLRRRVTTTTVKCGASLAFASVGAGIGAVVFRPPTGQWIGCIIGDLAGPIIVTACSRKFLSLDP